MPDSFGASNLLDELLDEMDEFENNQDLLGNDLINDDRMLAFSSDSESADENEPNVPANRRPRNNERVQQAEQSPMASSTESVISAVEDTINKQNADAGQGNSGNSNSNAQADLDTDSDTDFFSHVEDQASSAKGKKDESHEMDSSDDEEVASKPSSSKKRQPHASAASRTKQVRVFANRFDCNSI